ncbi:MAG: D-2-hydroxyacid dehydrogenase, partial [Proteobacteria bacterium]|nr:D-2-hydroxyacid dehydrogenase [Pseudomonadota bacterium]
MMTTIVIQGAASAEEVPGIAALAEAADLRFTMTADELRRALPGAEVLLGWDFAAGGLEEAWRSAGDLRWIHWCGAGVNAALFPGLVQSDVVLTNARGIFDRAMAEYTLGQIIAFAKRFPESYALQARGEWRHRLTERIEGARVLVVGTGSIGREIARTLRA